MKYAALALAAATWGPGAAPQDGIASKYAGDAGIERDPDVLLSESL